MPRILVLHDLPNDFDDPDGPTIKEANLKVQHNIPIGSLVEVKYDTWYGDGVCEKVHARLIVVGHHRDCDGTPLYVLANKTAETLEYLAGHFLGSATSFYISMVADVYQTGLGEQDLTVVEVTDKIKRGADTLDWIDDETG